jgi:sulfate adenylyltransferase subunit 1 (EFTu-like GTPase family)
MSARRFLHSVSNRGGARVSAGDVVQTQVASDTTSSSTTGTIAIDGTIPQNTEGGEIITLAFTPKFASSKLRITLSTSVGNISTAITSAALFQNDDADALRATILVNHTSSSNNNEQCSVTWILDATNTTARTYKVRIGGESGTTYFNRSEAQAAPFGAGRMETSLVIEEIAQ